MKLSKSLKTSYYIKEISADKKDVERLYKLGIVIGAKIEVLLNLGGGGVLIDVEGSEVAIGNEISNKIEVVNCKK
ncbi:MAG: ferrous iron transport protein A [Clostridiales bacterium]|nr:ferrous iron transport protein A [Clostridiales bacterium]